MRICALVRFALRLVLDDKVTKKGLSCVYSCAPLIRGILPHVEGLYPAFPQRSALCSGIDEMFR